MTRGNWIVHRAGVRVLSSFQALGGYELDRVFVPDMPEGEDDTYHLRDALIKFIETIIINTGDTISIEVGESE